MLESREIHRNLTGREQRGWFSPAVTNTLRTFDLAAALAQVLGKPDVWRASLDDLALRAEEQV